ncbi:helix-turn-helix domain-containing protein [Leptothoe sp. PORK10 BA2]|uniref:helix-turn-helix domain-containing protein n=1 Tax=Leptothoe sp. PORK10 BA2 TaxID=3110254 RepID=UPI002B2024DD|nr:helix-turn-helix domain-containing protein [Leptothoe sp. PORK10 BA2]MEA5462843.1 helix-turn-helix domain-containing protein [Leptothoe sp. PORK10 BA2]
MTSYSTVQKQQLSQLGAYLQEKRQEQGKSLEDISLQTYIRAQLLKAVEAGDTTDLPQPIFVQGFIRRYADALGLDGTNFSKQFPVHSIPDTPRPTPRPATQVDMSYQTTPLKPAVQTKAIPPPKPKPPLKPAIGAMPQVNNALKAELQSISAPKQTDKATTRDFTLDPRPIPSNELAALGLDDLTNVAASKTSSATAALGKTATDPSLGRPAPVDPSPIPMGSSLASGSTSGINWLPWGIGAALIAGLIAILINIFGGNGQKQTAQDIETEAPQTEVAPAAPAPATEPVPEPEPAASNAPVSLNVKVTEAGPSWMSINVDGEVVFEGLMDPNTEQSWEGQESITMNVGNAGAAIVSANGSEPKPAGEPGGTGILTFKAAE